MPAAEPAIPEAVSPTEPAISQAVPPAVRSVEMSKIKAPIEETSPFSYVACAPSQWLRVRGIASAIDRRRLRPD